MLNDSSPIILPVDLPDDSPIGNLPFLSANQNGASLTDHIEGQLSVDVLQTPGEIIVVAPMAGTPPGSIELHLHNDLLTIRGERTITAPLEAEYFYEECYWGKFSRTIVLPVEVRPELARSEYKNGVLTIQLPKAVADRQIPIMVVED